MEVLISAILFGLILIGLANLFIAGRKYVMHARARMASSELGRYFLDPLQLQVRQDQWGTNCLSSGVGCGNPTFTLDNMDYKAAYQVTTGPGGAAATDVRKVTTKITWQELNP